jgi:hypothetical protein
MEPVAPIGNASATNFNPFTVNINTVRGQESGYATLVILGKYFITANNMQVGIGNTQIDTNWYIGGRPGSWSMHSNGNKYNSGSVTSYGSSYGTAGKVVSVAFDASVTFYVDGVSGVKTNSHIIFK